MPPDAYVARMRLLSWKTAALFSAGLILVRRWTRPRDDFRYKTVLITGGSSGPLPDHCIGGGGEADRRGPSRREARAHHHG